MPRMEPFRKMFSRPVRSGWKPAPSSSRAETRPCTRTWPLVGSRMRVISLSAVLLPDPLAPMMPKQSPGSTSKLTSRRAHSSSRPISLPRSKRLSTASRSVRVSLMMQDKALGNAGELNGCCHDIALPSVTRSSVTRDSIPYSSSPNRGLKCAKKR